VGLAAPLAWLATLLETTIGVNLIAGFRLRYTAWAGAVLLASFGLAMTISFGVKAPLNFSVFADAAGALLLASSADDSKTGKDKR
jgi:uncharacterized membrane protein YphA (DoxX/SURF4 family)